MYVECSILTNKKTLTEILKIQTLHDLDRKTVWSMSLYITISEKKIKSTFPIDFTVWVYLSTLIPCRQMVLFLYL